MKRHFAKTPWSLDTSNDCWVVKNREHDIAVMVYPNFGEFDKKELKDSSFLVVKSPELYAELQRMADWLNIMAKSCDDDVARELLKKKREIEKLLDEV